MSTNLATILVGLGYDLSALQKGAPEAFRLINSQTLGMSAEMKRASREGAESFRLIDEALGIHLSRPLTRILTQEFPSLAKGLQSILGVGIVGALGFAGVELFDKIAKGIEKAQKAQEALQAATLNVDNVFAQELVAYKEKDKAITAATSAVDKLAQAEIKEAQAAQAASGWFTHSMAAFGDWMHQASSFQSTLNLEQVNSELGKFKEKFDAASLADSINHTQTAAKMLREEIDKVNDALQRFSASAAKGHPWYAPGNGDSPAVVTGLRQLLDDLNKLRQVQDVTAGGERAKDALAAEHERILELQGDLKRWNDESTKGWETWIKINAEIEKAAGVDFSQKISTGLGTLAGSRPIPSLSQIAPPPGAPRLADQAELEKVTNDQNESWKKAGEIVASLETPFEKYSAQLAIVRELEKEGRISTAQFAQAQQLLQEQLEQSEQRMEKLLRSGGAAGGFQAFLIQMQGEASKGSSGQFTFDILNKGLQGFEDETVKALTGAKTSWAQYFASLDQMALKFLLNKEIASLLKGFGGSTFGGQGAAAATQLSAGTLMQTAATTQLAAAQLMATSLAGGSSGFGAFVGSVMPHFASGTDFAPGGLSLVGENGPELVNLPTGASVTPNSMLRGGHTFIAQIDAKGAEIGVEAKIARALEEAGPRFIMQAVVETSEAQRRTAR